MRVVLGLGSNVGSREALLRAAVSWVGAIERVQLIACARVWETAPVGPPQPAYFNTAVLVECALEAHELLHRVREIEELLGRERRDRWAARTLDIDVLWIDAAVISTDALVVPHPELLRRAFALAPLLDVAPDARDPRTRVTLASVLATLPDASLRAPWSLGSRSRCTRAAPSASFVVTASDRADALATAAEALVGIARDCDAIAPRERRAIRVHGDAPWTDDARALAWLTAIREPVAEREFAARYAVVLHDGADEVRGALIGDARAGKHVSNLVSVHCDAGDSAGEYRIRVTIGR